MKKIGLFLIFVMLFCFAILFHPSIKIHLFEFSSPWMYAVFSPQLFFLLSGILVLSVNKVAPREVGVTLQPLSKNLKLGIGLGAIPYFIFFVANIIVGFFHKNPETTRFYEWNNWMLFSYFFLAPITEEFFFRGVVFHALKGYYSLSISILASSILFAASHSSVMIGPLLLGIIGALLVQKTKSIFPGILFHALSNGLPWFYVKCCPNLHIFEKWIFFRF